MSAGAATKPRFEWVDSSKGLSILLVVLLHVAVWFSDHFSPRHPILFFSEMLIFLRMPLFFFISGFLAYSAIRRPLSGMSDKTVGLYLIYAFWTLIYCLYISIFSPSAEASMGVGHYLLAIVIPTVFWYIWVLPFYYLVAWMLHRAPVLTPAQLLIGMAALSGASPMVRDATIGMIPPPAPTNIAAITSNMIWFFLGLYGRGPALRLIDRARPTNAIVATLVFLIGSAATIYWKLNDFTKLPLIVLALYMSFQAIGSVRHSGMSVRALKAIGRNTLPVYIFHLFGLSTLSGIAKVGGLERIIGTSGLLWGFIVIPAATVALIVASRIGGAILSATPLSFLIVPVRFGDRSGKQVSGGAAATHSAG